MPQAKSKPKTQRRQTKKADEQLAKAREAWELRLRSRTARHIATAQKANPDLGVPEVREAMGWSKGQAQDFLRGPVNRVEPFEA